jgi:hypothetical protein
VGGRLILINSVLTSLVMFMVSFLRFLKVFLKKMTSIDLDSTGKAMSIRRSTGWQNGHNLPTKRSRRVGYSKHRYTKSVFA